MSEEIKKYLKELKNEFSREMRQQVGVLTEDFQHKLDLVVEGHQLLDKKVDDFRGELKSDIKEVDGKIDFMHRTLDKKIDDFKGENRKEHEEIKELRRFSHSEHDKRLDALESELSELDSRTEKLEATRP